MWIDEADGFAEIFRGYLPYYLFIALPIFILMSPVNPVSASHEFSVYRMQQYDLHGVAHGCRSASVSLEGRPLSAWGTSRHCVVARLQDVSIQQYLDIRGKAGALLLVLPKDVASLNEAEKEHIQLLEAAMAQQETSMPVHFVPWAPALDDILADLQSGFSGNQRSSSALQDIISSASANGYQFSVSASTPARLEWRPPTLHARLPGRAPHTIVIAAHYDASAIAPELSVGADSNASGAAALLALARAFARLHAAAASRAAPTLLFLLTATGPQLNYFGTKKWLEEQLDSSDGSLLQDVSFAMCLESLSASRALAMQVSRPPRAGSGAAGLRARLGVPVRHKKINLADDVLAWHHERFSIRRASAFTLTSLKSHKDPARSSIVDVASEERASILAQNTKDIAVALAAHIYNLTEEPAEGHTSPNDQFYADALDISEESIKWWYDYLSSQARAGAVQAGAGGGAGGVTAALQRALQRHVADVTVTQHAPDKREPEFSLYAPTRGTLNVYSVKPAIFDLILTLAIAAYLALVYLAIVAFPSLYEEISKLTGHKAKVN